MLKKIIGDVKVKILVINAGSSSLKYQLIDMQNEKVLAKGLCERIGFDGAVKHKTFDSRSFSEEREIKDHKIAFEIVAKLLVDEKYGVIKNLKEIAAVGHRIVQGAEIFKESCLVTDKVLEQIDSLSPLAPLHNHAQAKAIKAAIETFGKEVKQVVVFDTSFHQTIEEKAFLYGLPYEAYEKYKIRKYGFHGTSHRYVSAKVCEMLNKDINSVKIVSCHLGNGSSICAIENGKSVETTMGLTPLDGLLMGTRCGNIDPSCLVFLMQQSEIDIKKMDEIMNKRSGLLGISGVSSDYRDVKKAADSGNKRAKLALLMLSYQIRKKIAACVAAMDGIDILTFEGGIGENSYDLTISVCEHLNFLGAKIDVEKTKQTVGGKGGIISTKDSKIDICVVPTNEELLIAKDTLSLIG